MASGLTQHIPKIIAIILAFVSLNKLSSEIDSDKLKFIISTVPYYILIIIGSYTLGRLGYDIYRFNDLPEEINKLALEVAEAREFLTKKKVI